MAQMKKWMAVWLTVLALAGCGAEAEVFLGPPPAEWAERETLAWTIFDVNEGDAMLLECGGESMLVDGGPSPSREELRMALEARNLKNSMKYLLATHHHEDHITGMEHLLKNGFTAEILLHPYEQQTLSSNKRMAGAAKAAKVNGMRVRQVLSGDRLALGGAEIALYRCTEVSGVNAQSIVAKVTFGDAGALLCADISGKAQHWYLANLPKETLKADLIKMPHHAITPAVPAFLDAVNPEAAIVTNRSRDVQSKSITQMEGRGWPAFFSGDGTVYAVTDGRDWYVEQTIGQF